MQRRNFAVLKVREHQWLRYLEGQTVAEFRWRSLYKLHLSKRSGDLQWRVLPGALATNVFWSKVHHNVREGCVFCDVPESVQHVFAECHRLLTLLSALCGKIGAVVYEGLYILGPRYSAQTEHRDLLTLFGQAELATWLTRRNKFAGFRAGGPRVTVQGAGLCTSSR